MKKYEICVFGVSLRSYQRYAKRIHDENKQIWFSITQESLGTELLKMLQSFERTFDISKKMAEDPKCEDRIEALNCMNDSRLNIIHLLVEYPDFARNNRARNEEKNLEQDSTLPRIH